MPHLYITIFYFGRQADRRKNLEQIVSNAISKSFYFAEHLNILF